MKKIVALLLSLVLCVGFCGCAAKQPKDNTDNGNGVDLSAVLSSGKIPELAVTLGASEQDLKTLHNYSADASGETGFYISDEGEYTRYLTDAAEYYIINAKNTDGVSAIVCLETACGLHCNAFEKPEDVKGAFPSIEFTEAELTEDEKFLSTSVEGAKALVYSEGSRRISFIFLDEQLINVILTDTDKWSK